MKKVKNKKKRTESLSKNNFYLLINATDPFEIILSKKKKVLEFEDFSR